MTVQIAPIYAQVFSGQKDPDALRSSKSEILSPKSVDFSVDTRTWQDTAKKIALLLLQIVLFPWGIYELVKYCMQRIVMTLVYPAQSMCLGASVAVTDEIRSKLAVAIGQHIPTAIVRHVVLEKDGTRYSGLMVGRKEAIQNGKWIVQATGNCAIAELACADSLPALDAGFNILVVNGPGVGRSAGTATPQTMGSAQEIGLQFLETAIKAKTIALGGLSLGGAMMGQAILQHSFKKDVQYAVIPQMTFGKLSEIPQTWGGIVGCIAPVLIEWTGLELDTTEASRKLQRLGIREFVINAGCPRGEAFADDGVIPGEASLGQRLQNLRLVQHKTFVKIPNAPHTFPIQQTIQILRSLN